MLRTSLWFVPALILSTALAASILVLYVDAQLVDTYLKGANWIFTGSAEAAREILSTIAGSVMTVAALAFSMTMVSLTLASNQFGPRILRNFLRDTGNQCVLGTFIGTYVYCLMVLRTVRGEDGSSYVPQFAVTLAVLLLLVSLAVLIYFIHHVATSIQAEQVVNEVSQELQSIIRRLYPARNALENAAAEKIEIKITHFETLEFSISQCPVLAEREGYLQVIDYNLLLELAVQHSLQMRILFKPGQFVLEESPLLYVYPKAEIEEQLAKQFNEAFVVGPRPTPTQDVKFSIEQLTEIAVRSLSPGINDPYTAMTCVDHLGNGIALLLRRVEPLPYYYDEAGVLRIITEQIGQSEAIYIAFDPIREYGRNSCLVMTRMLEVLARVSLEARTESVRKALYNQIMAVSHYCGEAFTEPHAHQRLRKLEDAALSAIKLSRDRYPDSVEFSPMTVSSLR